MGTSNRNIIVLFFEFLFKHKLSSSITSILVHLALLLVTGVSIGLSVFSFLYDSKLYNFIGFWFLLAAFLVILAIRPTLSQIVFPDVTPVPFSSRISVILIIAAFPFFISMMSHLFLYLITFPLSLFFTEPWEDFSYGYCFNASGFCNIYHDVDWSFTFIPLLIYGLFILVSFFITIPIIFLVFGSMVMGCLWVVYDDDDDDFFDSIPIVWTSYTGCLHVKHNNFVCLISTIWSYYPGCVVFSLSISSYVLIIVNIAFISNFSTHYVFIILLFLLPFYNIWRLRLMREECEFEHSIIKSWYGYFVTITGFSLFLMANYLGRAFVVLLKLIFDTCFMESLCDFFPDQYSFAENLASLLVLVVVSLVVALLVLIYAKVFQCCTQFCKEFNEFAEENRDTKDTDIVYA
ncbi:hypothetical protein P9112_000601 [Eukaryota sp. TZLM1-RC]